MKRRATWSETRRTPLRLLRFDWTYSFSHMKKKVIFDLEVAFCFLPHEWKYRSLHWLASCNSFAYSLRFSCSRKRTSEKMAEILRHHHQYGLLAKWRLKRNEGCLVPRHHYSPRHAFRVTFVSDMSPKCIDREGLGRRRTGTRHCRPESLLGAWARGTVGSGDTGFEVLDFRTSDHFRFKSKLGDSP